ncbi:MAG: xanthine dehydrogenase family protein subunit [Polaromonas sp.]|nr:xanthine dehydrogenase family protein subunit [Polaromonas sp.]
MLAAHAGARPLAGGMTLIPTLKQRLASPSHLVDLSRLPELQGISLDDGMLRIGAAVPHAAVAGSPLVRRAVPALAQLAGLIGDAQVRNRGTLGGSIANNDPAADYPAAMLGLDAEIVTDRRSISAEAFFTGMFSTALAADEIVVAVQCRPTTRAVYLKHRHPASGYAVVGVFLAHTAAGMRVAVTGAAPCVMRWREAELRLSGRSDVMPSLLEGLRLSPTNLNHDQGATAAYRAHLAGVLLRRAVAQGPSPAGLSGH